MTTALKTRCPHCRVAFRVSASQLGAAKGMVRCGLCFKAFNGQANLEEFLDNPTPPAGEDHNKPQPDAASVSSWKDGDDFYIDDNFDLALLEETPQEKPPSPKLSIVKEPPAPEIKKSSPQSTAAQTANGASEPVTSRQPSAAATPGKKSAAPDSRGIEADQHQDDNILAVNTEDMARWQPAIGALIGEDTEQQSGSGSHSRTSPKPSGWLWYGASALALLFLGGQLLYFNSSLIDSRSTLWPMTKWLCTTLNCPLKANRDLSKIASSDLVVRTHPRVANALFVDAVIINNASFAQPFPNLTLLFEDLQGTTVAKRSFQPREYLHGELRGAAMMPSNQPVKLELEIIDPGREAVSFRLYVSE